MSDIKWQSKASSLTFEKVEQVMSVMLVNGVKPTIRAVRELTGGRTETVTELVNAFYKKRDQETAKIADELGVGEIYKLIAVELSTMNARKTQTQTEQLEQKQAQVDELSEIIKEQEADCASRIQHVKNAAENSVRVAEEKAASALARIEIAKQEKAKAEAESAAAIDRASRDIEKAEALVDAADKRTASAQRDMLTLCEQVKELIIEQAKNELEKPQFKHAESAEVKDQ